MFTSEQIGGSEAGMNHHQKYAHPKASSEFSIQFLKKNHPTRGNFVSSLYFDEGSEKVPTKLTAVSCRFTVL